MWNVKWNADQTNLEIATAYNVMWPSSNCGLWDKNGYFTIIPRAWMGSESIAHEAEGGHFSLLLGYK